MALSAALYQRNIYEALFDAAIVELVLNSADLLGTDFHSRGLKVKRRPKLQRCPVTVVFSAGSTV